MTDQTTATTTPASADGLVTEPVPAKSARAGKPLELEQTVIDPAAALDPAAHRDPAKVRQPAEKPKRQPRKPRARREASAKSAKAVKSARAEVATDAAIAAEEHGRVVSAECAAAYTSAVDNEVERFADMPKSGQLHLRLAGRGAFVEGDLAIDRQQLLPEGSGVTYGKDVEIGPDGPPTYVDEAWLVAESGEAVRCAVGPLSGGNGYHARVPAKHLLF